MLRTITNIKEHHLHCQRSSLITLLPFRPKDWEKLKQKLRQKDIEKFGIKTPALNCKQHLRQKRLCTSTGFRNERERSKYWPQFQDAHLNVFWYSEACPGTHSCIAPSHRTVISFMLSSDHFNRRYILTRRFRLLLPFLPFFAMLRFERRFDTCIWYLLLPSTFFCPLLPPHNWPSHCVLCWRVRRLNVHSLAFYGNLSLGQQTNG